ASHLLGRVAAHAVGGLVVVSRLRTSAKDVGFAAFEVEQPAGLTACGPLAEQLSAAVLNSTVRDLNDRSILAFRSFPALAAGFFDPSAPNLPYLREMISACAKHALEVLRADIVVIYEWKDHDFV